MRNSMHHWGGGMMVEGMDGWPPDVQAMGTEGDVMFMVFPQGYGRARLYLNFPTVNKHRYRGGPAAWTGSWPRTSSSACPTTARR
ncbi:hypothetical protein ACFSTC_12165 [Nonomuraea ferruginea]